MAGTYERFRREGFALPKYLLPWGDKNILSVILYEFLKSVKFETILLIINKNDHEYLPHIKYCLNSLNLTNYNILELTTNSGQAETARIGVNLLNNDPNLRDRPILIHNIDTFIYQRDFNYINAQLNCNDGYIDIFESSNHEYSYALFDKDFYLQDIVEKVLVSNYASSGLYGFKNSQIFIDYYSDNFIYISEIYRSMIASNKKIKCSPIYDDLQTLVLGTPEEYFQKSKLLI